MSCCKRKSNQNEIVSNPTEAKSKFQRFMHATKMVLILILSSPFLLGLTIYGVAKFSYTDDKKTLSNEVKQYIRLAIALRRGEITLNNE